MEPFELERAVQLADLDWDHHRGRVLNGKGKKQRWVGVSARTLDALWDYMKRFRGDRPGALFLNSKSEPLRAHALNVILQRVAARVELSVPPPGR